MWALRTPAQLRPDTFGRSGVRSAPFLLEVWNLFFAVGARER